MLWLVLMTNDVRQHHFHKQRIYLLRFFPLIQPLFPLNDYFRQNNIDLHVEIIHCIQAIWRHWSQEPITRPNIEKMRWDEAKAQFTLTKYHIVSTMQGNSETHLCGALSKWGACRRIQYWVKSRKWVTGKKGVFWVWIKFV